MNRGAFSVDPDQVRPCVADVVFDSGLGVGILVLLHHGGT